ncbi:MAG: hypothetical protein EOM48_12460, partial [Bacilli bacterium]|nr:hypothetical protein [Bacilli bacterium]
YEGYLADGKTASSKLKQLFNQIAKWMAQIYTTLRHSVDLDPRIIEVFDSLSDKQSPLAKQLVTQEENKSQMKSGALYQDDAQAQYDAVVSKYRNTDQWMKAPNGKPTNLTERQWVLVRTPAFLEWFGDWINDPENASKVVDENGEPLVVYHGSQNVFYVFLKQKSSYGYFFTPDKYTALFYGGNLYQVYLASSNPANLNDYKTRKAVLKYAFGDKYDPAALGGYLESRYYDHNEFGVLGDLWELDSAEEQDAVIDRVVGELEGAEDYNQIIEDVALFREGISETGVDANRSYGSQDFYLNYQDDVLRSAEDMGYDGVSMTDPSSTGRSESFIVFKPTQIKSVNNQGTWDAANPSILFQEDGKPKLDTGYPKQPVIDLNNYDFEKSVELMEQWKKDLEDWVSKQGDLLQFGNDDLVYVIHKNVIPNEKPWRYTSFIFHKGSWIPSGHGDYDTKFEAVLDNVGAKDYRPDILFQETTDRIKEGSLAVLHNITAEKLSEVEKIGGLPSPSLAITKPNIPFDQFGEITLIADPSVAVKAMNEERLYDRDVW